MATHISAAAHDPNYRRRGPRRASGSPAIVVFEPQDVTAYFDTTSGWSSLSLLCTALLELTVVQMTLDQNALRGVMRLRGFSLMHSLLEDHGVTDPKITKLVCLDHWAL